MSALPPLLTSLALLLLLAAVAGLLRAPHLYARLHYLSLGALLPPLLLLLAKPSLKAALIALLVAAPSPLVGHLIARAATARRHERPPA